MYSSADSTFSIAMSLRTAMDDIYMSRYVIWRLFLRDFTVQFRQKILGYFWAVIGPLLAIATFVFMNKTGFLHPGDLSIPYPLFVFIGTGMWGIMIASLQTVSVGLLGNGDLLLRTNVPAIALALAGMAGHAYNITVHCVVLGIILVGVGYAPSWWIVFYPLLMVPLIILGIGFGLLLAVIGTVARDVSGIVMTFLGLLMYLTPVIYDAKFDYPLLQWLVRGNPIAYLVDMPRTLVIQGQFRDLPAFGLSVLLSIGVLVLGVHGFYMIKDKVAERL
jgi:lipopolysaccharide transport system permease protein